MLHTIVTAKRSNKPQHNHDPLDLLPETIRVPWDLHPQLKIGRGYDAMAFCPKHTALESPLTDEVTETQPFVFKFIRSSRELFKDRELHGAVNLSAADFGRLGLSWSSSHTFAASDSTVMIYCTARATSTVSITDPQLLEKARSLKDRQTFQDTYGDYFVSGMERSYGLVVFVTLR